VKSNDKDVRYILATNQDVAGIWQNDIASIASKIQEGYLRTACGQEATSGHREYRRARDL